MKTLPPIGLSAANFGDSVNVKEFFDFIAKAGSGYRVYVFKPKSKHYKAAFDVHVVLQDLSAIVAIVSALWMAYRKFIAPQRRAGKSDAGIYIGIRRPDGTCVDLWLRDQASEAEFERQFKMILDPNNDLRVDYSQTTAEIEHSEDWSRLGSNGDSRE